LNPDDLNLLSVSLHRCSLSISYPKLLLTKGQTEELSGPSKTSNAVSEIGRHEGKKSTSKC